MTDDELRDAIKMMRWREHGELSATRAIILQDLIAAGELVLNNAAQRSRAEIEADITFELTR